MKYIDEFRNKKLVRRFSGRIKSEAGDRRINIMEVCGTHTQSFRRFALSGLLPENLRLISGPGCPVCVSPKSFIDSAIELGRRKDTVILTFGDMLRIPGSASTLEKENSNSADIRVVYSCWDALKIAQANSSKKVIFLAVGFETTAPTVALTILEAAKNRMKNISFLCALKLIPPAMLYLLKDKRLSLSGFLCPGHVSTIIGAKAYLPIAKKYHLPCCVAGFEPLDILEGLLILLKDINAKRARVSNEYSRAVRAGGNLKAQKLVSSVFEKEDALWRGLGIIPDSGLGIRGKYSRFDAAKIFSCKLPTFKSQPPTKCRCGDVLKGLLTPTECPLFSKECTPDNPVGPCMVSSEGACGVYYRYR